MRECSHTALALLLVASACGERELSFLVPEPEILRPPSPRPIPLPQPGGELFDPERILEVDLFVPPEDWDRIRAQRLDPERFSQPDCQARPYDEHAFYRGIVAIDRTIVEDVAVRQHGFFELNEHFPSLEISFDELRPERRFDGRARLLLESAVADRTLLRTCLGYGLFEQAGVPAPRCSFAHLRVNGADMGVYVHVEAIDRDFARARFDGEGPIFEGRASDFRDGWMATFRGDGDRASLAALADALETTDDQLVERVSAIVDLDAFFRFWAVETTIGHYNGYAGDAGRFFLFDHPERGLLFLPSATQTAFTPFNPSLRVEQPASVYAQGELARRLYLSPEGRPRYLAALEGVLDEVWDEPALLHEIDRLEALIAPRILPWREDMQAATDSLREFVRTREAAIRAELPEGGAWSVQRRPSICVVPRGAIEADLTTSWDTLPLPGEPFDRIFATGSSTIAVSFDGVDHLQVAPGGAAAGMNEVAAVLVAVIATDARESGLLLYLAVDPTLLVPGTIEIDNMTSYGQAAWYVGGLPIWIGYVYGTLELSDAGTSTGAPIRAHLAADLY